MDKATQARLTGIETRAKALGWDWGDFVDAVSALCYLLRLDVTNDNWCPAAERILSLYEPGPMVKIGDVDCRNCDLNVDGGACGLAEVCPGTGTFKLIPVEVPDDI